MKRLSAITLAIGLSLLPGLALADIVGFPALSFPDANPAPATQGCIQPATLTTACQPGN